MYRILLLFLILTNTFLAQTWSEIIAFPGSSRDDAISFKIGDTVYCGTGIQTGWTATRDFYAFDCTSENWFQITSLPIGKERQYASGCSYDGKGYVFGGRANGQHFNDLWQYDPLSNSWSQLASLPSVGRSGAHTFRIQEEVFIVGGQTINSAAIDEVWKYDILNNTWTQLQDLPFGSRWRGTTEVVNDTAYLISGRTANGHFPDSVYRYLPTIDEWEFETTTPFSGRTYLKSTVIDEKIVICFGLDSLDQSYNDVWSYDVSSNQWQQLQSLPDLKRRGGLAFSHGQTLLYTTGIDENNIRLKETWKLENATSVSGEDFFENWKTFPNPVQSFLYIETRAQGAYTYEIMDKSGHQIRKGQVSPTPINIHELASGVYFIRLQNTSTGKQEIKKIVKL